jgi:hypothetical protein
MINHNSKPIDKFIKFIEPCDQHGRLQIIIKIYDEPVMSTANVHIFSTIEILEEDQKLFGQQVYEAVLTESEVKEAFANIIADPMKFKTSK